MDEIIGAGVRFQRIRRITGYLVGTLERFNNAKRAETLDRVMHCGDCCGQRSIPDHVRAFYDRRRAAQAARRTPMPEPPAAPGARPATDGADTRAA